MAISSYDFFISRSAGRSTISWIVLAQPFPFAPNRVTITHLSRPLERVLQVLTKASKQEQRVSVILAEWRRYKTAAAWNRSKLTLNGGWPISQQKKNKRSTAPDSRCLLSAVNPSRNPLLKLSHVNHFFVGSNWAHSLLCCLAHNSSSSRVDMCLTATGEARETSLIF